MIDDKVTDGTIRAVIFDYGGVLMRTADPTPRRELERRLGLESGDTYKIVFGSSLWDAVQVGRISSTEFWADVSRRLALSEEQLADFRRAFRAGDRLDEELVALIRHLREEGYRIALLSNAPAGLHQRLQQQGIADGFDVIVVSGYEGVIKPDPAIYELTLERLGVPAKEAVFVDDFRENIAAARQAGLRAVRFRGLAPLRQQLRDLGIPVPDPILSPLPDVRAVIFDWGGVMEGLPDDAHVNKWERRLALEPGTLERVLWGKAWQQLSVGANTEEDYAARVAEQLDFPNVEAGEHFIRAFYASDRFYPQVATTVRALQARYQVALLSNASPDQANRVREQHGFDIHAEFDVYVNSAIVGMRKPDPAIFNLTLDRLGVEPQQAIFLDDMVYNVDSARELGIHTVQFVDPDTSLARLEALLGHPI
ncbi:MAG: HAD family phosphatase [Chloroflexota bacterium]|nr:HAD family phosphatase [Chloroflexota bacterium]